MLIDAHLHITRNDVENNLLKIMEKEDLYGFVAGTNPDECAWVRRLSKCQKRVIPTYGLHPWYADQFDLNDMNDYLQSCPLIGEIGMDSVWCNVDLSCQRKVFVQQMNMAEERGCPVILHTKGQEKEIGEIIADYSIPILVHWYSSDQYLDLYLNKGCYFTVGPDVLQNYTVQQVVKNVPTNRLFVESDGIAAIEWAQGVKSTTMDLPRVLKTTITYISEIKGIEKATVRNEMKKNLENLVSNRILYL